MRKHITYCISFLLIFGLTVNEYAVYAQKTFSNDHQSVFVHTRNEFGHKHVKTYVYSGQTVQLESIVALLSFQLLRTVFNDSVFVKTKLQLEQYMALCSKIANSIFRLKKQHSSLSSESLYIA